MHSLLVLSLRLLALLPGLLGSPDLVQKKIYILEHSFLRRLEFCQGLLGLDTTAGVGNFPEIGLLRIRILLDLAFVLLCTVVYLYRRLDVQVRGSTPPVTIAT